MNFFIDGMVTGLHDYPDFLDSIIGTVPDEDLIIGLRPVITISKSDL